MYGSCCGSSQSVSFSSALHAPPCDIRIATVEMRNTWGLTVNPLGDDSAKSYRTELYLCSKDVFFVSNSKTGFCAGVGKSDWKSVSEPQVMFSLKSACMASFLSLPPLFLFLAVSPLQPSYNINMSSDTSKLLFIEAVALSNSSNDDLFPALDTCLLVLILGPASSPAPDCRSDPSLSLSVCVHICLSTHSVCLSICRSSEKMITILGSEWVWQSLCAQIHPDTVGFPPWHSRDCMNTGRCLVEPKRQTVHVIISAHQLTLVSVCVLSEKTEHVT